jgi:hypothetical protein
LSVNTADWPGDKDALEGVKDIELADAPSVVAPVGISVITAEPIIPAFPRLAAVSITVCGDETEVGAV